MTGSAIILTIIFIQMHNEAFTNPYVLAFGLDRDV